MRLSIIIAVYNSHGAVKRQLDHFTRMGLPDDTEIILVDDGSSPPLTGDGKNLKIIYTNEKRAWTQGLARNAGARTARGEYLLMTDIDHILSKEAIDAARAFEGDKMIFPRYFGVLLDSGVLSQAEDILTYYGLDPKRIASSRGLYASVHGNTFAIKRSTFESLGGYSEEHSTYGHHAARRRGEDCDFNKRWNRYAAKNGIQPVLGPKIYMFPVGRYHVRGDLNPMGLFHDLSQEEKPQPMKP